MKRSLVYSAIIIVISGYYAVILGQDSKFHPFISDINLCNKCHVVNQTTSTSGNSASYIAVNADSSYIHTYVCLRCHPQKALIHPVQISTTLPVPKDFPLLPKTRVITCATCHNPHFSRFSDRPWVPRSFLQILNDFVKRKKQYKTYFLRRNNSKGELCMSCHNPVRHHLTSGLFK